VPALVNLDRSWKPWCGVKGTSIIEAAMATNKGMIGELHWNERYKISEADDILTPALIVYPEIVASNIACTLALLGGNADRWRAHIKTAKLTYTLRMLVESGVRNFKCATTLELLEACREGASDVLLAFPVMGANARRVCEIASEFPKVRVSALAENDQQVRQWRGSDVGLFLDINPGMNRTGIEQDQKERVLALARTIQHAGLEFRGVHYYDGQFGGLEEPARTKAAHAGYDRLLELMAEIQRSGLIVPEVVTAGTPTFPCSLAYPRLHTSEFVHRVSPGTVVYCDATCLAQLSPEYGYQPAVMVLSRVVSHPNQHTVTCDAGHKAVSADAGVPTCVVLGHPELIPLSPSEEHLPMQIETPPGPAVGEMLYLLPRHICPTVNNFNSAFVGRRGRVESIETVTARGRESRILQAVETVGTSQP
jgi:D-serine deaminase-like pyridoxal phosphate-dependent protein